MIEIGLYFFQFCGFYPVVIPNLDSSLENEQKVSKFLKFWSALHAVAVSFFILYMGVKHDELLYTETSIGQINDILVYFSLLSAHLLIIIEAFVKRGHFSTFWDCYKKIYKAKVRAMHLERLGNKIILKVALLLLFTIFIEILVISNITQDLQWTNFWYWELFSLLMTRVWHLQQIFFVDLIFHTLEDMNCRLRNLITWGKAEGAKKRFSEKLLCKNLMEIREQCKNLMEMIICVNRIFCWSQVLNVGQHFIEVTSELYWIYAFVKGPIFLWRKESFVAIR